MSAVHQPQPGDRYAAPWAEYSLVRAAVPPAPPAEQLRCCSDCKRPKRVLWATDRDDGPLFCGDCLATGRPAPAPSLGTWRPAPGEEHHNAAKAELGSFARPAEPAAPRPRTKPEASRTTTRELWAELSAAVPR